MATELYYKYMSKPYTFTGAGYATDVTIAHGIGNRLTDYIVVSVGAGGTGGTAVLGSTAWDSNNAYLRGENAIDYKVVFVR